MAADQCPTDPPPVSAGEVSNRPIDKPEPRSQIVRVNHPTQTLAPVLAKFVLEKLQNPVMLLDRLGRLIQCNRAVFEGPAGILDTLLDPELGPCQAKFMEELRSKGSASTAIDCYCEGFDGGAYVLEGFWIESCYLVTVRDLFDRRAMEEEIRRFQRVESLGLLTASLVHDLNNLLTPILYSSRDLVQELDAESRLGTMAAELESAALRAASMVRGVLTVARSKSSRVMVVDVNSVVRSMLGLIKLQIGPQVEFSLQLDSEPTIVFVDRARLEHALLNLVSNAKSAMPRGGRLTIATRQVELPAPRGVARHVELIVTDTGSGMTEEVRKRAFEPFFSTRTAGEGTGLGLASVDRFVSDARGEASIESVLREGTKVSIRLPCATAAAVDGPSSPWGSTEPEEAWNGPGRS